MYALIVLLTAILGISFLASPMMGGGWYWDADNALGFAALAGMLLLSGPGGAQRSVRTHEWLGYTVLGLAAVHVLWFLLFDSAAIEYIKPDAPAYMLTGIGALILLGVLVVVAVMPARLSVHRSYSQFRMLHRLGAILGIGFALHHVIGSAFYIRTWYQSVLLIGLAVVIVTGLPKRIPSRWSDQLSPMRLIAVSVLGAAIFTTVRNLTP